MKFKNFSHLLLFLFFFFFISCGDTGCVEYERNNNILLFLSSLSLFSPISSLKMGERGRGGKWNGVVWCMFFLTTDHDDNNNNWKNTVISS